MKKRRAKLIRILVEDENPRPHEMSRKKEEKKRSEGGKNYKVNPKSANLAASERVVSTPVSPLHSPFTYTAPLAGYLLSNFSVFLRPSWNSFAI